MLRWYVSSGFGRYTSTTELERLAITQYDCHTAVIRFRLEDAVAVSVEQWAKKLG